MTSKTFYEGQRSVNPNQRVYILTRSAFPGLQRYSASTWSGDIQGTWKTLKLQIPAGLNFCLAGIPYWTTDIGGHIMSFKYLGNNAPEVKEEWRELMIRWFQYGTFCPIFRNHAAYPNEMYHIAPPEHKAYQAMMKFAKLRYRLMPYIYSLAAKVTFDNYTIMRGLVFDFQDDPKVYDIGDQFMFGPSVLINPVTDYQVTQRTLYLPRNNGGWYDMWSGKYFPGEQTVQANTPYDEIPIFIQAGSIIPFGPEIQYTSEKPADPILLYLYSGADGEFNLYEDEEINFNYTSGVYSIIQISYHDTDKTLTIHKRKGEFPGMRKKRTFNVVFISKDSPAKLDFDTRTFKSISYDGEEKTVNLTE
jgi:alpha-D-xyloside xylohydrolase